MVFPLKHSILAFSFFSLEDLSKVLRKISKKINISKTVFFNGNLRCTLVKLPFQILKIIKLIVRY